MTERQLKAMCGDLARYALSGTKKATGEDRQELADELLDKCQGWIRFVVTDGASED